MARSALPALVFLAPAGRSSILVAAKSDLRNYPGVRRNDVLAADSVADLEKSVNPSLRRDVRNGGRINDSALVDMGPDPLGHLRDGILNLSIQEEGPATAVAEGRDRRLASTDFVPLACNANVDCSGAAPLASLADPSSPRDADGRVWIPCGSCASLDSSIDLPEGLNVEGKLLIPSEAYDNGAVLRTTSLLVQGELEVQPPVYASDAEPTKQFKVVLNDGSADRYFHPDPNFENGSACDPAAGCKIGRKPIAVAGGILKINGIEGIGDCASWTKLHNYVDSRTIALPAGANLECWRAGDEVLLTSPDMDPDMEHMATIQSVDRSTNTLTLSEDIPPVFEFASEVAVMEDDDVNGNTDARMAIEVARLTRSIVFEAEDDDLHFAGDGLLGGHLIILHTPSVAQSIVGVELRNFGQQGNLGRYPIHFHKCADVPGSYVAKNSVRLSNQRCYVIHGTNQVHLFDNVAHEAQGHCYFTEDGNEYHNTFENNLGSRIRKPLHVIPGENDNGPNAPSVFWITNPANHWIGNVATGSDASGMWFDTRHVSRGDAGVFPIKEALGTFRGNIVHSHNERCLMLYPPGWTPETVHTLEDNVVFRCRWEGVFLHVNKNVRIKGGLVADSGTGIINFQASQNYLEGVQFIGYSPNFKRVRGATGTWWYCPSSHASITGITLHPWLFFKNDPATVGMTVTDCEFAHFGKADTGCGGDPVAIRMSNTHVQSFHDAPNVLSGNTFHDNDNDVKRWSLCATEAAGILNSNVEDVDGSLIGGTSTGGFIVSNNPQMTAFLPSGSCTVNTESCSQTCEGACLRQATFNVNNAASTSGIEMMVSTSDGAASHLMQWHNESFNNPDGTLSLYLGHFGATLPNGDYEIRFLRDGEPAWPDFVELNLEEAPSSCSPYLEESSLTVVMPEATEERCGANLIKQPNFDDGKFDAWQHFFAKLELASPGADGSAHALKVTERQGQHEFVSQYVDASCIAGNGEAMYIFGADIRLENSGNVVTCDPALGNCPIAEMKLHYWDSTTKTSSSTTKALGEVIMPIASDDGFYKLQGFVKVSAEDAAASRVEIMISRPADVDYIIDNVSLEKFTQPTPEATDPNETMNVAVGAIATQSSTIHGGVASRAVDGNTDGHWAGSSVTHTGYGLSWWRVDLGEKFDVRKVSLWNRMDCCKEYLKDFMITLYDGSGAAVAAYEHPGMVDQTVPDTHMDIESVDVRYVMIQFSSNSILMLAEVQVFAFGRPPSAAPTPVVSIGPPPENLTNVAIGKSATQSSLVHGGVASRAVDGNTNGYWWFNSVTHTGYGYSWWKVDLGQEYEIWEVVIWNRLDCCKDKLKNFAVEFFDSGDNIVFTSSHPDVVSQEIPDTHFPLGGVMAQYVKVRLLSMNVLHVAEVEVFAASS